MRLEVRPGERAGPLTGPRSSTCLRASPAVALVLTVAALRASPAVADGLTMDSAVTVSAERLEAAAAAARDWLRPKRSAPPRPTDGVEVKPGESLQESIDAAAPGATILLAPGVHGGPIAIHRPVTLWGPRDAVVRSGGTGHTITVLGEGVSLLGFSVEGSGRRFDLTEAAVSIRAGRCRVEGLAIRDALFGITAEQAHDIRIIGNQVFGTGEADLGLRGDGIRIWEVRGSEIADNLVTRSRDLVVWYSPGNRVTGNYVEFGRYGTHFMYSHRNTVHGNTYVGNLVGVFVMYSDSVEVTANRMAFSDPTGGLGLGVKESGELLVRDNILLRNQAGIYLDTSPLQRGHWNTFTGNRFVFCETGVSFHRGDKNNRFRDNEFRGCAAPVRVGGGGDAGGIEWLGNYFDDYQGYDLDADGFGDLAYELHRLSDQITAKHDALQFFRGTPALSLLDLAGRVLPFLAPRVLVRDPKPRLGPLSGWAANPR